MQHSQGRILTTHAGSIPRPGAIRELLQARLEGEQVNERELSERVKEAVDDVVQRQREAGRAPIWAT